MQLKKGSLHWLRCHTWCCFSVRHYGSVIKHYALYAYLPTFLPPPRGFNDTSMCQVACVSSHCFSVSFPFSILNSCLWYVEKHTHTRIHHAYLYFLSVRELCRATAINSKRLPKKSQGMKAANKHCDEKNEGFVPSSEHPESRGVSHQID